MRNEFENCIKVNFMLQSDSAVSKFQNYSFPHHGQEQNDLNVDGCGKISSRTKGLWYIDLN